MNKSSFTSNRNVSLGALDSDDDDNNNDKDKGRTNKNSGPLQSSSSLSSKRKKKRSRKYASVRSSSVSYHSASDSASSSSSSSFSSLEGHNNGNAHIFVGSAKWQHQESLEEATQLQRRTGHLCRFCRLSGRAMEDNHKERGYKVCLCDDEFGYAHRVCFYRFLGGPRGRGSCPHCRTTWLVNSEEVAPFLERKSRVRIWRAVHFVASLALALLGLLAATMLFAYLAKGLVYTVSGSPEFEIGHDGIPVRLEPSPGDLVTGGTTTLLLLLLYGLHRVLVACMPCYTRCCGSREDDVAEENDNIYDERLTLLRNRPSVRRVDRSQQEHGKYDDDDDDDAIELDVITSGSLLPSEYELEERARHVQQERRGGGNHRVLVVSDKRELGARGKGNVNDMDVEDSDDDQPTDESSTAATNMV